jgi:hypothetical protein
MFMIKIVGLCLFFLSSFSYGIVPVEGIILGDAKEELQTDPLEFIFSDIYDKSNIGENKKVKLLQSSYQSGESLRESCEILRPSKYQTPWQERQAKRSFASTLQYIGLDTTIKAIGAYARKFGIDEEGFGRLRTGLVNSYCSRNITIFSLKTIEKALDYYYKNPSEFIIPSVASSPFASKVIKDKSESEKARSREFDLVINNFRDFCSWGGDADDYRMLTYYLSNPYIMAFVIKNLEGVQDKVNEKALNVLTVPSENTVQVLCEDLICRKTMPDLFQSKYPLAVGSTGLKTDLSKLYCHHFRLLEAGQGSIPEVKSWVKASELEDPVRATSNFISLMTGVPDFFNTADEYQDLALISRSSIDERWGLWSKKSIESFSRDLLYEDSLRIKIEPNRNIARLASHGFEIDLSITLGEMDQLLMNKDTLDVSIHLKLSKSYLRFIRTQLKVLSEQVDLDGVEKLKKEIARYISGQLKEKEKHFREKLWNENFPEILAEELMSQSREYRGSLFETYKDEVLTIPIRFSYGLFALSYLRYRSDLAAR